MSGKNFGSRHRFLATGIGGWATIALLGVPAKAAQFEFRCGSQLSADMPQSIRVGQMWAAIEKETGGRVRTQFFPDSVLGGNQAMFTQLRLGALHFYVINPGNLSTVIPVTDISTLGFVFKDGDEGFRVMAGPLGAYLRQEVLSKGVYLFRPFWLNGMNHIGSNTHAIKSLDDLHGFKVRCAESKITIDFFKELGASPNPLNFAETYTGLKTGLIDGEAAPLVTIESSKFYEVNKFISLTNHNLSGAWLIANGDVWKSLPPDLQAIVERNHAKYAGLLQKDTKKDEASTAAQLRRQGVSFNQVDQTPFRVGLHSYYESWANTFGSTAWGLLQTSLGRKLT